MDDSFWFVVAQIEFYKEKIFKLLRYNDELLLRSFLESIRRIS